MKPLIHQLNLSNALGGAEMSTHAFSLALAARGWPTELIVRKGARFWSPFDFGAVRLREATADEVIGLVPPGAIVVVHGSTPEPLLLALRDRAHVVGLAHHALSEHNRLRYYELAHWLLPVSHHVVRTLERHGLRGFDPRPLYGVADVARGAPTDPIVARSPYEWDSRKPRDRILSRAYPILASLRGSARLERREALTLGIVSRISDAKQFPALFDAIAPAIASQARVRVEIFGSGLFQKVRALERAIAPIRARTRFWGWQSSVAAVFASIDLLLAGLPEREALGLNVIEAQACGVPVLAVDGGPFPETIIDGRTGFLYRDPRTDAGASFAELLGRLCAGQPRPDPRLEAAHLARFAFPAFAQRVDDAMHMVVQQLGIAQSATPA